MHAVGQSREETNSKPSRSKDKDYSCQYCFEFDPWKFSCDDSLELMVPLPYDDGRQEVTDLSLNADYTHHIDGSGNHIAMVVLERGTKLKITAQIKIAQGGSLSKIPEPSEADITPGVMVPISEEIAKLAHEITEGITDSKDKAEAIYTHVWKNLIYEYPPSARGAQETLVRQRGDCGEFSSLYVALCRAVGLPSRVVIGWLIAPWHKGPHAWAETWIEEIGWIPVDTSLANDSTTYAQLLRTPSTKSYYFGNISQYHLTLSRGTGLPWLGKAKTEPETASKTDSNHEFLLDGVPFAFWSGLVDGKVPYLQLPYFLITEPARRTRGDGFKVKIVPRITSLKERLGLLVDLIIANPTVELCAIATAILVRIVSNSNTNAWLELGLWFVGCSYALWFLLRVFHDVGGRLSLTGESKLRDGLGLFAGWAIHIFFAYRMFGALI